MAGSFHGGAPRVKRRATLSVLLMLWVSGCSRHDEGAGAKSSGSSPSTSPGPEKDPSESVGGLGNAAMNGHWSENEYPYELEREAETEGCGSDSDCPTGPCLEGRCVACSVGPDCDADGLPDACAIATGRATDCDENGRPDRCDLDGGALDCDESGIPDACEALSPRCVMEDDRGFVTYYSGTLPIILTAPHGGDLKPEDVADRDDPGPLDAHTRALAEAVDDALFERTGQHAHRIVVNLHRSKLDANRDIEEGAQGDPAAEDAWREFHRFVAAARHAVETRHGRGLLLDLHGLSASRTRNELGVLLTGHQLLVTDDRLAHPAYALDSSIRSLVERSARPLPELLRGPGSLGARLSRAGHETIPSEQQPDPGRHPSGKARPFFNGGYITWRHGSRRGGFVDAIQVETLPGVRAHRESRARFAAALADAVDALFIESYRQPLAARLRARIAATQGRPIAGERLDLQIARTPPLGERLDIAIQGLGRRTWARFEPGERITWASVHLDTPGRHRVRLEGTSTVAVDAGLDLDVEDPAAPRVWLEVWPSRVQSGDEVRLRLWRWSSGAPLARQRVRAEGVTLDPPVWLGLTESATYAEALTRIKLDAYGGREVALRLGPVGSAVRVEDGRLDPDLVLWLDGQGPPLEDRAASNLRPRELPQPLGRAFDGPRPPAMIFERPGDRIWLEGVRYDRGRGYTVAFWFRVDLPAPEEANGHAPAANPFLLSHGRMSEDSSLNIYLSPDGALRTALRGERDGYEPRALDLPGRDVRDGRFHHYALVVRPGPEATVYLDGEPGAVTARGHPLGEPRTAFHVGGRHDLEARRDFKGAVGEIKVWAKPLEEAEIRREATP